MDAGVWELGAALVKALTYAATLSAAGLALFYMYALSSGEPGLDTRRPILRLALAAVLLTALKFPLLAGAMDGPAGLRSLTLLRTLSASGEGQAALLRLGGLVLLCAGSAGSRGHRALLTAGALLAAASFAVTGHVHARHSAALSALLALHLLCAAFWIGALWPLGRLVAHDPQRAGAAVARFSRLALIAVPLLLLAGAVLLTVLLGAASALWTSAYGRGMSLKLLLAGALLCLAAHNKLRLTPRLHTPAGRDALLRAIRAERVLAACILVVTAAITSLMGPDKLEP